MIGLSHVHCFFFFFLCRRHLGEGLHHFLEVHASLCIDGGHRRWGRALLWECLRSGIGGHLRRRDRDFAVARRSETLDHSAGLLRGLTLGLQSREPTSGIFVPLQLSDNKIQRQRPVWIVGVVL